MKYADKLSLLLKGVKMEEIRALEEQEASEIAEPDQQDQDQPDQPDPDLNDPTDYKELFENANNIIKEMEEKLQQNQAELSNLKNEIAAFNNRQTQEAEQTVYDDTAVFKELFNKN